MSQCGLGYVWASSIALRNIDKFREVDCGGCIESHDHKAEYERPGDPKVCTCGMQRDPVTHSWLWPEDLEQLRHERRARRAVFGSQETADQMNRAGL
jgi:hypothetical protein